jgi:pyridoxine 4-dehydrogenase
VDGRSNASPFTRGIADKRVGDIGFIPWFPIAAGRLAEGGSVLDKVAKAHDATSEPDRACLVLKRSPIVLPISGTSKVAHLEENVTAANVELSEQDFAVLDREGRKEYRAA